MQIDFSIIIPALNEEGFLPGLIDSIHREFKPSARNYEILLADNGSSDRTTQIAEAKGARVIDCSGLTISAARNKAAFQSTGGILVFLDADMLLDQGWARALGELEQVLERIDGLVIGGSTAAPVESGWIGRAWFPQRDPKPRMVRYVGTGHMLLSRRHFEKLSGFDPELRTGEDYDFCTRTWRLGGRVEEHGALVAWHRGVPGTLLGFIRREVWHGGSGDLRTLFRQRVSMLATAWTLMHIGLIVSAFSWFFFDGNMSCVLSLGSIIGIAALVVFSASRRARSAGWHNLPSLLILFYVYFAGRALGLVRGIITMPMTASSRSAR